MVEASAAKLEDEVRVASEAYLEVLLRLDHAAAASFWAEDALLMPSAV